jgi:hypothetical protein
VTNINEDQWSVLREVTDGMLDIAMARTMDMIRSGKKVKNYKTGFRMGVIMAFQAVVQESVMAQKTGKIGPVGRAMTQAMNMMALLIEENGGQVDIMAVEMPDETVERPVDGELRAMLDSMQPGASTSFDWHDEEEE